MTAPPADRSPLNWRTHAGRALEAALNRALALDPDTRAGLRALDGRKVALAVEAPPVALQIAVAGERLEVGPVDDAREPDLGLRDHIARFLGQVFRRAFRDAAPRGLRFAQCRGDPLRDLHADDVDALRDDVERLAARVQRMRRGSAA